jgi:hypothetical protein
VTWQYGILFDDADSFLEWLSSLGMFRINACHMHHTYKPNHITWKQNPNHKRVQDGMKNYHVNNNGWDDIGQHITIFPDGKIMTGRDPSDMPVSAKGYNGSAWGHPFMFEMIGNFDNGHDKLQGQQLESAVKICRYWDKKGIETVFHRECLINGRQPKSCPGTGIDKEWFIRLVKKEDNYMMKPEDAEKIIKFLSAGWFVAVDDKSKDEFQRLANILRELSGQKTQ